MGAFPSLVGSATSALLLVAVKGGRTVVAVQSAFVNCTHNSAVFTLLVIDLFLDCRWMLEAK
jgi:hypothetical protein